MTRVLVIDDDVQIRRLLKITLEKQGFKVFSAQDCGEGMAQALSTKPDLVLLDLNLPDRDGKFALESLRTWSDTPVIVLSVRNTEEDIVELLNLGADDYMIKPFSTGELTARMRVALRHIGVRGAGTGTENPIVVGGLEFDGVNRRVRVDGTEIKLTPTEYALLRLFVTHLGRIITREQIIKAVWGPNSEEEGGSLRVHINQLRKKIERNPSMPELLVTEPGVGYRLKE